MVLMTLPAVLTAQVAQKVQNQTSYIESVALIDLLEDGEMYTIEMITEGCFDHSSDSTISLCRISTGIDIAV